MASSVEIRGLAELHKALQELPVKIERNVLRGGLRAGAKVMEAEAARLCPEGLPTMDSVKRGARLGELKRSIRVTLRASKSTVRAKLSAGNKVAWYAHLVEFGTARHWIKPKSRKSLFVAGLFKEVIDHPGARPKPFMRPAFDGKWRAAIDAMADYIRTRLPKEFKKAGK
jgi:HK97 gp10 family phage protein